MQDEKKWTGVNPLAVRLAGELGRGAGLIGRVSDKTYAGETGCKGSLGAHFRHNLEFAELFLKGLKEGRIDYSARERDVALEVDREYAINRYDLVGLRLRRLPAEVSGTPLLVRSESEPEMWHESTAGRELEFILSHTVHHHALIAERLAVLGVVTEQNFGVAPSTLKFWETKDSDARAA